VLRAHPLKFGCQNDNQLGKRQGEVQNGRANLKVRVRKENGYEEEMEEG
jgi:hypothetical protein